MDHTVPILLACLVARGGGAYSTYGAYGAYGGAYADELADEYEPVAVAALPLHRPLPVLRLLSASPLAADLAPASSGTRTGAYRTPQAQRAHRTRDRDPNVYAYAASSEPEYAYSYEESYERPVYSPSSPFGKYAEYSSAASAASAASATASREEYEPPAPVVVYARPHPGGGYSYRRRPSRPAARPQDPVIIRVHKYKLVRD